MDIEINIWPYISDAARLVVAAACGAALGWERERREKSAGLRTHMLTAVGACLYAIVALAVHRDYGATDVMRVLQGALIGTGFICAGVIFREGHGVRGLTTAAGLWIIGAVGVTVGFGYYWEAIAATALALVVMTVVRRGEARIHRAGGGPGPAAGGPVPGGPAGPGEPPADQA